MVTSIDPLRIYIYNGDALLRFCPQKYHPFDAENRDKYVVHDDYRPTWEVPTLARLFSDLGFTFKETFNAHIRSLGKDPQKLWNEIEDVIRFDWLFSKFGLFSLALPFYQAQNRSLTRIEQNAQRMHHTHIHQSDVIQLMSASFWW